MQDDVARNICFANYQAMCTKNPWIVGEAGPGPTMFDLFLQVQLPYVPSPAPSPARPCDACVSRCCRASGSVFYNQAYRKGKPNSEDGPAETGRFGSATGIWCSRGTWRSKVIEGLPKAEVTGRRPRAGGDRGANWECTTWRARRRAN
jgi:hypothetical protein